MYVSAAQARGQLPELLKALKEGPVTITRRGEPVGVLISPEEYKRLSRVHAYLEMLRLSAELRDAGVTAKEVYEASRRELEERP